MGRKVWTAAELEEMDPRDVDALFDASIIRDLDDAPPELLARTRERLLARLAESEPPHQH